MVPSPSPTKRPARCRWGSSCKSKNCKFFHAPGEKENQENNSVSPNTKKCSASHGGPGNNDRAGNSTAVPTVQDVEAGLFSSNDAQKVTADPPSTGASTMPKTKPKASTIKCRYGTRCRSKKCKFRHDDKPTVDPATNGVEEQSATSTATATTTTTTTDEATLGSFVQHHSSTPATNAPTAIPTVEQVEAANALASNGTAQSPLSSFLPPTLTPHVSEDMVMGVLQDDDDDIMDEVTKADELRLLLSQEHNRHLQEMCVLQQRQQIEIARHDAEKKRLELLLQQHERNHVAASLKQRQRQQEAQRAEALRRAEEERKLQEAENEKKRAEEIRRAEEELKLQEEEKEKKRLKKEEQRIKKEKIRKQNEEWQRMEQEAKDAQMAQELHRAEQEQLRQRQLAQEERWRADELQRAEEERKRLENQEKQRKKREEKQLRKQQEEKLRREKEEQKRREEEERKKSAEAEQKILREQEAREEEERLKKQRWQEEIRRQKEAAQKKKLEKKDQKAKRHERYLEELEQQEQIRAQMWENHTKLEVAYSKLISQVCAAEFVRQNQGNPSFQSLGLTWQKLVEQAPEEFHNACHEAFHKLFLGDVENRVTVAGFTQDLNGRHGTIKYWDAAKEKFCVALDTKKGKQAEGMFFKPGHLEAFDDPVQKNKKKKNWTDTVHYVKIKSLYEKFSVDCRAGSEHCLVNKDMIRTMEKLDSVDGFLKTLMAERDDEERQRKLEEERDKREEQEARKRRAEQRRREQEEFEVRQREYEERKHEYEEWKREEKRSQRRANKSPFGASHRGGGCDCPRCMFAHLFEEHFFGGGGGGGRFFFGGFGGFDNDEDEYDSDEWDRQWSRQQEEELEAKTEEYAEVLGVDVDAPPEVIKREYRRQALKYHPDKYRPENHEDGTTKDEAEEHFKNITNAYDHLMSNFDDGDY